MPSIVRLTLPGTPPPPPLRGQPQAALVSDGGTRLAFPWAPLLGLDGIARRWEERDRPTRPPVLVDAGPQLRRVGFTLLLGRLDWQEDVEADLHVLRAMARYGWKLRLEGYGPSYVGWWRITGLSQTDEQLQPGTNRVARADMDVELTRFSSPRVSVGPVTGGVEKPAAEPAEEAPRTHTVEAGDTLWALAVHYYGDGSKWTEIADANGVKDPRRLAVGQQLTIPAGS